MSQRRSATRPSLEAAVDGSVVAAAGNEPIQIEAPLGRWLLAPRRPELRPGLSPPVRGSEYGPGPGEDGSDPGPAVIRPHQNDPRCRTRAVCGESDPWMRRRWIYLSTVPQKWLSMQRVLSNCHGPTHDTVGSDRRRSGTDCCVHLDRRICRVARDRSQSAIARRRHRMSAERATAVL